MKPFNLNADEAEALLGLFDNSDGWRVLLKAMEALVSDQEHMLIKLKVEGDGRNVLDAKLKAEGARKLLNDCIELKDHYRKAAHARPKSKK